MFNIGPLELMVILLLALVVVGPSRLPEVGRSIGKGLRELRKVQDEVRDSINFNLDAEPAPPRPTPKPRAPRPAPSVADDDPVTPATPIEPDAPTNADAAVEPDTAVGPDTGVRPPSASTGAPTPSDPDRE
jgi:sec-independent protein translocase protein TatA